MPQGSGFNQAGGEPRLRKDLWAGAFWGSQVVIHKKGSKGISLVHFNVTKSWSGEGRKENLWQGPTFTRSSEQAAYSQFVGMLRQQKLFFFNEVLKIFIIQCPGLKRF